MALNSYANLKASIIAHSGRDDLSAVIDDFITLAEVLMFANETPLRLRTFEVSETLTTIAGSNTIALPDGFLEARSVQLTSNGDTRALVYNSPSSLLSMTGQGVPSNYSITNAIIFDRVADAAYDMPITYYSKPAPLSSANQSNVILAGHPNIYLYGALAALYDFTDDLQNSEAFVRKMARGIVGANNSDQRGRTGPRARGKVNGSTP
tara:strand:+ start:2903 stop:3526 length:624 start_codon:yes stop_codon:yes gene_type:complete